MNSEIVWPQDLPPSALDPGPAPTRAEMARRVSRHFPKKLHNRQHHHYAKWKILLDPLYGAVYDSLQHNPHPVLDIGCGVGLLAFYLRERGLQSPIYGLDFDVKKIRTAQQVSSRFRPHPVFEISDMRKPWPDVRGNVCLLDVLQYLPVAERASLLERAASHVTPGGSLIIRGSIKEPTWRWRANCLVDHAAKMLTWMKALPVTYPTREELVQTLTAAGLHLHEALPLWGSTPLNMQFLSFKRPALS